MKRYIPPSVKVIDRTESDLGYDLWLKSRERIVSHNGDGTITVGAETMPEQDYYKKIMKQGGTGLQYNNFPQFVLEIQGSVLFRDILFNINKIGQWAESLRFIHSILDDEDVKQETYAISGEYENIPEWEQKFDEFFEYAQVERNTDKNRMLMPYSLTSKYWVSVNLKTLLAVLGMMKLKMPFFYDIYGVLIIEAISDACSVDLTEYVPPFLDSSLAQYFSRTEFKPSYQEVDDLVILKAEIGLIMFSQFLRQTEVTIKGFFDMLTHVKRDAGGVAVYDRPISDGQSIDFVHNVFHAQTLVPVTYITDKQRFLRTITNRLCWFSMSDGDGPCSWSSILNIVLKDVKTVEQFISLLPCSYCTLHGLKKIGGEGADFAMPDQYQLTNCTYREDVKFRNEGLEKRNLPCAMLSNSVEFAQQRYDASPNLLNYWYLELMKSLVPHQLETTKPA